ncbi:MAG: DUF445 domain-containing protein [Myxococcales bacterium]|nr:DUF445 domain-containing protein [Myxococcales bacterium]
MSDSELRRPTWASRVRRLKPLELFEKYRRRMVNRDTQLPFDPADGASDRAYTIEQLAFETGWGMQLALNVFMPICGAVFASSFLWDFHGLLRSCSVAGMIGFATNWVAIKMLFWPRESRPIFGQGLIPSQRDQLIEKVADEVLRNLINEELILGKIEETRIVERLSSSAIDKLAQITKDPEFKADLRRVILTWVAEITSNPEFRDRLGARAERSLIEVAGEGMQRWVVARMKTAWHGPMVKLLNREIEELERTVDEGLEHLDDLLLQLPIYMEGRRHQIDNVLSRMLVGLVREVDVRQIVLEQLSTVTTEQLEQGFKQFSDDKLSFITLLGGVLGVVGGSVIVWPLPSLATLAVLGLLLWGLDRLAKPLMDRWVKRRRDEPDDPAAA